MLSFESLMDASSSRKKPSFKSHNSYMHGHKISLSADEDRLHEEQPILSDHRRESAESPEIIVKIDGGDPPPPITRHRESSLDFWHDESMHHQRFDLQEDPPSKLIGQFLNKQKAGGGDLCLDVDLDMDELRNDRSSNSSTTNTNNNVSNTATSHSLPPLKAYDDRSKSHRSNPPSRELKTDPSSSSFHNISSDDQGKYRNEIKESPASSSSSSDEDHIHDDNRSTMNRRRSMNNTCSGDAGCSSDGQVVKCTSIQRKYSGLGRIKTKSRLLDPPPPEKSGQVRSEGLGKSEGMASKQDEDEEDPLFDEDLPEEFKNKPKFDTLTFMQWISLILIVTALICTTSIGKWKSKEFRGLHLWKWEVLILVLICGRLVSGWGIRIVVFFIERNFFMRKRVLYFVYGVKRSVQNCIWLGLVLIAWHSMFDQEVEGNNEFLWYVNKTLVCMIVGTLLWLVKTLMVKILASSFHVSTFFDRIQESLFNQYVIEALSGPPHIEIKKQQEEEERTMAEVWRLQNAGATLPPDLRPPALQRPKSGKTAAGAGAGAGGGGGGGGLPPRPTKGVSFKFSKNQEARGQEPKSQEPKSLDESGINIDNLHKMNNKNVSAWNMKKLIKVVKKGVLITLDERVQHSSEGDEAATQIRSECEAKCAARKIFRNVAKPKTK